VILYLDTSALLKLYIAETHSEAVKVAVTEATRTGSATIVYPEARAALARRHREGSLTDDELQNTITALERDWEMFMRLDVTDGMARLAGALAERHALRGADAIHLAAAVMLHHEAGDTRFLSYDKHLAGAAQALLPIRGEP
jgi:uncharacterized protein